MMHDAKRMSHQGAVMPTGSLRHRTYTMAPRRGRGARMSFGERVYAVCLAWGLMLVLIAAVA